MRRISTNNQWDVHMAQSLVLILLCTQGSCWGSCSYVSECPLWGGSSLSLQPCTAQCSTSSRTTGCSCCKRAAPQPPPALAATSLDCSASPAQLSTEELPRVLCGGPRHFTTATVSSEEEPPEEPGQMTAAYPSVQGSAPKRGGPAAAPWTYLHHARCGNRTSTTWHSQSEHGSGSCKTNINLSVCFWEKIKTTKRSPWYWQGSWGCCPYPCCFSLSWFWWKPWNHAFTSTITNQPVMMTVLIKWAQAAINKRWTSCSNNNNPIIRILSFC